MLNSIEFVIPGKYYLEFLPQKVEYTTDFGHYQAEFIAAENKLLYIRKLSMNKGRFAKERYHEFANFLKKVKAADNTKLVFVDKT